jgi:hypothetical protein
MLFGATTCACGYKPIASHEIDSAIELSYLEALRAYWRVYWPTQLFIAIGVALAGGTLFDTVVQIVLSAVGLFLFVPRIVARPYRGFSIIVSSDGGTETGHRMSWRQRLDVWAYLWWRQLIASLLAGILSGPLNVLLSIMGFHITQWIVAASGVLVIGPILLKMLIGEPLGGFQLLAKRRSG